MILRRQHADGARCFRHAIDLDKFCAENIHTLAQQFQRNWRGAVEDIFKTAIIDAAATRVVDHHLQSGRDDKKPSCPTLLNRIKDGIWRKFRLYKRGQT